MGFWVLGFFGFRLFRFLPVGLALAFGVLVALTIFRLTGDRLAGSAGGPVASAHAAAAGAMIPRLAPDRAQEIAASKPLHAVVAVADGDTLLDLLMQKGVDRNIAANAIDALRSVFNPRALKVGSHIDLEFGPVDSDSSSRPLRKLALNSEPGRRVVVARSGDGFEATANRLPQVHDTAHFAGSIKSSLFESATSQGIPPQVIASMIHAFSYDVDFQRDLQPGDSYELLYQRTLDTQGQVLRTDDVDYAELTLSGKQLAIYRFTDSSGQSDYYNGKGESVRKALLRTPVDGARITSKFGMRVNPILGFSMMHKGVDFGVPIGTPVMAAGAGVIEKAGANGAYGLYIRIRHDKIHSTAYAHLSGLAKGIRPGRKVMQGQVIGYVGETGRATGPHLHYEVLLNNKQVNPMSVKFKAGTVLAGRDLNRFKTAVAEVESRLAKVPVSTEVAMARRDDN
jgi:murein DD-endopeptidase MepM/ murein hydrolase activator NlpD